MFYLMKRATFIVRSVQFVDLQGFSEEKAFEHRESSHESVEFVLNNHPHNVRRVPLVQNSRHSRLSIDDTEAVVKD